MLESIGRDFFLFLPAPDFPFVASAILSKILFPERFCLARGLLIAMVLSNSRKFFFGTLLLQPRQYNQIQKVRGFSYRAQFQAG